VADLSKTLRINFYQNRSSIVLVMTKNFGMFYAPQCITNGKWLKFILFKIILAIVGLHNNY